MTNEQRGSVTGAWGGAVLMLGAVWLLSACDSRGGRLFEGAEYPDKQAPLAELVEPVGALDKDEQAERQLAAPEQPAEAVPAPKAEPELFPGSDVFLNQAAIERRAVRVMPLGDITFSFVDTNIREVVRAILGDTLALNYAIDPGVQGTITVQTSRPLPRTALVGALENILRLVGAALVRTDGLYQIVPAARAPRGVPSLSLGLRRAARVAGFGVRIVPLEFVSAAEMASVLEPVAPEGGVLRIDRARNLLMLSGTERELEGMMEMVELFDVDWFAGTSFAIYPLERASAKNIVADLEQVFGTDGESPIAGMMRFVAVERINSVLVIAARQTYLDDVGEWIGRLDRGEDGSGQRLYVYYVQNRRATDLAEILSEIFELPSARPAEGVRLAPGLVPVEIAAGEARQEQARAAEGARREGGDRSVTAPRVTSELRIIADEANNALVVMATPEEYRQIEAALVKLDIVPLQVLIEATIAEVSLTDELRYGVQWFLKDAGNLDLALSEVASGDVATLFPGFSAILRSGADPRVVLNALEGVTDVKVISSPQILVLDNQSALLQVGDEVPVPVQQAQDVAEAAIVDDTLTTTIVTNVEFRDTGVILRVTPRVNAGGLVTLEIEQEVSDVIETVTSGIDAPTIQQRLIQSTVAIQSGETVVLGGLIRDSSELTKSGVPILQDIPVLGALFRNTDNSTARTELLVLITPRVIHNMFEAREITEELRQRLRTLAPLGAKIE